MFSYADKTMPSFYRCFHCGGTQCKLWRPYHDHAPLRCRDCAIDHAIFVDENHSITILGDQLGALLPAVPCENGIDWWGYTSVPPEGVQWWKALPNRPQLLSQGLEAAAEIADEEARSYIRLGSADAKNACEIIAAHIRASVR